MVAMAQGAAPAVELSVGGLTVRISNPDRVYFPDHGWTKLDIAHYYAAVGDGIVRALRERPAVFGALVAIEFTRAGSGLMAAVDALAQA